MHHPETSNAPDAPELRDALSEALGVAYSLALGVLFWCCVAAAWWG